MIQIRNHAAPFIFMHERAHFFIHAKTEKWGKMKTFTLYPHIAALSAHRLCVFACRFATETKWNEYSKCGVECWRAVNWEVLMEVVVQKKKLLKEICVKVIIVGSAYEAEKTERERRLEKKKSGESKTEKVGGYWHRGRSCVVVLMLTDGLIISVTGSLRSSLLTEQTSSWYLVWHLSLQSSLFWISGTKKTTRSTVPVGACP